MCVTEDKVCYCLNITNETIIICNVDRERERVRNVNILNSVTTIKIMLTTVNYFFFFFSFQIAKSDLFQIALETLNGVINWYCAMRQIKWANRFR